MISIMLETSKLQGHLKKHGKIYAMGTGALTAGIAGEEAADKLLGDQEGLKSAARLARTAGGLGAGWAMKKMYDKNKRKRITELAVGGDKTTEKTADVIEKTGGKPAVGHLRKHWKKYAGLAGAGVAASLAGDSYRANLAREIEKAADEGKPAPKEAMKKYWRGYKADWAGTGVAAGAGALAGAGKLYDRRTQRR